MTDRVPGAPGQYQAVITAEEQQKLAAGEPFTITLTRDDQPITEGTPYSKSAVLPDELAQKLCPQLEDPTPADALDALLPLLGGTMAGAVDMDGNKITGLPDPEDSADAATKTYAESCMQPKGVYLAVSSISDLNNITENGGYRIVGDSITANGKNIEILVHINVLEAYANSCVQFAFSSAGNIQYRVCWYGTWRSWTLL